MPRLPRSCSGCCLFGGHGQQKEEPAPPARCRHWWNWAAGDAGLPLIGRWRRGLVTTAPENPTGGGRLLGTLVPPCLRRASKTKLIHCGRTYERTRPNCRSFGSSKGVRLQVFGLYCRVFWPSSLLSEEGRFCFDRLHYRLRTVASVLTVPVRFCFDRLHYRLRTVASLLIAFIRFCFDRLHCRLRMVASVWTVCIDVWGWSLLFWPSPRPDVAALVDWA